MAASSGLAGKSKQKPGCTMLFALPFVAVGIGAFFFALQTTWTVVEMKSWVEVPAHIKEASLEKVRGKKKSKYRAHATYEYEFAGKRYTGNRVGIHNLSDNFGSIQRDVYEELRQHRDQRRPFRCFVDPNDPADAVLYRHVRWEPLAFMTVFAAAFGSGGLVVLSSALARRRQARDSIGDGPDDQPWLARGDWAAGHIQDSVAKNEWRVLAAITLYWSIAIAPLVWLLPEIFSQRTSHWVWITLLFPLIGLLLAVACIYQWARTRKFGASEFQMAGVPGVIGGQLAGVVRIPREVAALEGFYLKLSCIDRTPDSDGDAREKVIWQDERLVTETLACATPHETAVPVMFAIPFESPETSQPDSSRPTEWQLEVLARLPGVAYLSRFEVPVFKTEASRRDFKIDENLVADFGTAPDANSLLRSARIIKEPMPGNGVRLVFTAARNWKTAFALTLVFTVLTGIVWFLWHVKAPIIFPILFGLVDLLILYGVLELWFHRSVIEANSVGLTAFNSLLGMGRKRVFDSNQIRQIVATDYMSSGTHVWKNIAIVPRSGKRFTIAKGISSRLVERVVIDELNTALLRSDVA